jgi:hypothetical protein
MKKYNLLNNSLGWLMFVIAAVTYLMTLEPTASFWDCGEFIAQGNKLEVGHPPGNPIFMLAARFFVNFASGYGGCLCQCDVGIAQCRNHPSAVLDHYAPCSQTDYQRRGNGIQLAAAASHHG